MLVETLNGMGEPTKNRILGLVRAQLDGAQQTIHCEQHRQIHDLGEGRFVDGGMTIFIKIDGGDEHIEIKRVGPRDCCGG